MDRRGSLVAGAIAIAIAGAAIVVSVIIGPDDHGFERPISSLPKAMGRPQCAEGEEVSTHHIDYAGGSGFTTPTEALASALATESNGSSAVDFWGRPVQHHGDLAYDFILRRPDGSLEEVASATLAEDAGWLVSATHQCFAPNQDEASANG